MKKHTSLRALYDEASSGDSWGDAMNTWFAIASELYMRGVHIPWGWKYSPGAAWQDPREPDGFWFEPCKEATEQELLHFGEVLRRYTNYLRLAGKDY